MDTSFYRQPLTLALFYHLLLRANHEDKKIIWNKEEMIVKKGQLVAGRKSLSKESGISERSVRTGLDTLKSTNTIAIKSTNKFSIITVLNYEQYQQTPSRSTSKRPASDQQATTNNNIYKNDKNDNNKDVEKILKWAYGRARVIPTCSQESFRRSLDTQIKRVGWPKIYKLFEKSENAIQFLVDIKSL